MRTFSGPALLFYALAVLSGCRTEAPVPERTRILLGTVVTIKAHGPEGTDADSLFDRAFKEMSRIDSLCGYLESSDVARINRSSGRPVKISPEVACVLRKSIEYSLMSAGALDVTVGPLKTLWHGFEGEGLEVPSRASLDSAVSLVDYRKLIVQDSLARLLVPGASIDLGAIAKGYAVDRGVAVLESLGAAGGLVDAGGDIRTFGGRPGGGPWRVGLKDPRVPDSVTTVFELRDMSIATSGDYERYFMKNNVRYHHILDPGTGLPSRGCCSVTIIARDACDADAIATAVFVLGPEKGMELIESLPEVEGLIVRCDNGAREIIRSSGVAKYEKRP